MQETTMAEVGIRFIQDKSVESTLEKTKSKRVLRVLYSFGVAKNMIYVCKA